MGEDVAALVVVEHARGGTEFDGGECYQQGLGPVLHEDADDVAGLHSSLRQDACVAVDLGVASP